MISLTKNEEKKHNKQKVCVEKHLVVMMVIKNTIK